jgi:hypothetical protein
MFPSGESAFAGAVFQGLVRLYAATADVATLGRLRLLTRAGVSRGRAFAGEPAAPF